MKKTMFVFLFLSIFESLWSQKRENLSIGFHRFFMSTDNLAIFYSKQTNKNEWGVGLKYHFNKGIYESGAFHDKNLYSNDWVQSFGLMAEYRRYFFDKSYKWTKFFRPYAVAHISISYKEVQGFIYTFIADREVYEYTLLKEKPLLMDNNVGFGIHFFQHKKINGYFQTGGGLAFGHIFPKDYQKYKCCGYVNIVDWTYMLNVGLTYNLRDDTPQKKAKK